ncbi:MAG: ABC transporter permease subunit [Armatimonadota bacterium]|nr:ABC transporter permease subunit [Armatimonadota bacterium]MDW8156418.1 ABC transporter permease subunit [Armatimonadota bacterium]
MRRSFFRAPALPYLLVAPQLVLTLVFFYWPALQGLYQSLLIQDPFGLRTSFAGLANFAAVLADPLYGNAVRVTLVFSAAVVAGAMAVGLVLATAAAQPLRGVQVYRTMLVWPYAVAPAVAAALWLFLAHPSVGIVGRALVRWRLGWDYTLNGTHALLLVVVASVWSRVAYNFVFFLAGLQSIPRSLHEAAQVDGATWFQSFRWVTLPLLAPTTFFLLVVNALYSLFDTFAVIHALTKGGPGKATETLIYKVYVDGVVNLNLGSSSAQSVILLILAVVLTSFQFRFLERRVHYA